MTIGSAGRDEMPSWDELKGRIGVYRVKERGPLAGCMYGYGTADGETISKQAIKFVNSGRNESASGHSGLLNDKIYDAFLLELWYMIDFG